MPWCCEDEASPASEEILGWAIQGTELHVPALWIWEILNVLAVTVKRGRISAGRAKEFLEQIGTFNIRVASSPDIADFLRLQALAERHGLTSYDVAYLDLAASLSLPLATQDGDLRKAALAEGIEVLG